MAERTVGELFQKFLDAMNRLDFDALADLLHPEYVEDYPQSGERVRGVGSLRAMLERYPGSIRGASLVDDSARVVDEEERWVLTPGYTVLPLAGARVHTTIARVRYPDDSVWHIVSLFEIRDGRIWRRTTYFAPEFEPPEWRREIVEIIPRRYTGTEGR